MQIYYVLALSLINGVSVQACRVLIPLYMLELGAGPLMIGLLATSFSVLPMVLSMPAGRFIDRYGSRWLLVGVGLVGGLGMLMPYFVTGIGSAFVAAALIGLTFGIYHVAVQSLVGQLSGDENRTQNFSNYSLTNAVTGLLGPLIAGFSIDLWGHTQSCLYLALAALMPGAALILFGGFLPKGERRARNPAGGANAMLSDSNVRKVLAGSSVLHTGQDLYRFYFPVYAHGIGLSASVIGMVLSANSAAAFVVRIFMRRLISRFSEQRVLSFAFYSSALCLVVLPLFEHPLLLGAISFVLGFGMGTGQPIITMLMFGNSPKGRSGEAMGLRMTVLFVTRLVGPVAFGAVASAVGLMAMFWGNAALLGVGGSLKYDKNARK